MLDDLFQEWFRLTYLQAIINDQETVRALEVIKVVLVLTYPIWKIRMVLKHYKAHT